MSSEKEVKIYFVRHGETQYNTEKRIQGFCDSPLTDRGISQARSVGKGLEDIEFTAVYTSESQRVIDTANFAVGHRNLPTKTDPRLKEMNFGALESLLASEISERYGDVLERLFALNDMNLAPPEGESYTQLYTRTTSMIKEIIETHKNEGGNILVFSHGVTIGIYLMQLAQMSRFPHHDNCGVSVVRYTHNQFEVETIASTDFRDHSQ
ncbi:probable phosphoglycerate mutase [Mesobacillus persicus]|uniref:phosphoglycerate mutase (2,3-diphosphoglycerate-dependent) n=1 Tax=Mesobacillus persicus TaxID=930146 RepID=A0A1H8APS0_9BACI|nr:histidine phosphatase family protein [Mesobacillus persicus]SEM72711.1 probable phosphoglycerate mutase [Mesobacillus persicus]